MNKLLYISILFFQGLYALGQKPIVELLISPKSVIVGEEISVTVKSNIQGDLEVKFPATFTQGYSVMNGMESEYDQSTNKSITFYYHSQNGRMTQEGTYTIGPAYIKKGNRVYHSNKVTITVRQEKVTAKTPVSNTQIKENAFGIVASSEKEVYEGQAVLLSAKVFSKEPPSHIENYKTYQIISSGEKYDLPSSHNIMIEEQNVNGVGLYVFEYDKQLVFPALSGKLKVKPFELLLFSNQGSYNFMSQALVLKVKKLPDYAPATFYGGIGEFKMNCSYDKKEVLKNEVVVMEITISGHGNLQNLKIPKLKLPKGVNVYGDPIVKESFVCGTNGMEGEVTYRYNLQIGENAKLDEIQYTYFDPNKQKYITLKEKGGLISMISNEIASKEATGTNASNLNENVNYAADLSDHKKENKGWMSSTLLLTILTPSIALAFVFLLFKKRKEQGQENLIKDDMDKHKTVVVNQELDLMSEGNELLALARQDLENMKLVELYDKLQKAGLIFCKYYLHMDSQLNPLKTDLLNAMKENGAGEELTIKLEEIFQVSEELKYGLGASNENASLHLKMISELYSKYSV
jgi:hypothetical protein